MPILIIAGLVCFVTAIILSVIIVFKGVDNLQRIKMESSNSIDTDFDRLMQCRFAVGPLFFAGMVCIAIHFIQKYA